jgi:hypothetical protein
VEKLERIRDLDEQTSDGALGSLARHALDDLLAALDTLDPSREVQRPECAQCEGGGQTPDPTVSDGWLRCEACGGTGLDPAFAAASKDVRDA